MMQTAGIHHITAFVRNAQDNVDFYAGVLGLRMVKKTVNFDAPEVYHLYFGNEGGSPGTIITFFPSEHSRKGQIGGGQVGVTTYVVPEHTLDFWEARLAKFHVSVARTERFSETYLQFQDPDGLQLELVARAVGEKSKWTFGGVPSEYAIKGLGGAILYSVDPGSTSLLLKGVMGLKQTAQDEQFTRFHSTADIGNIIDVKRSPVPRGSGGAGTVHHIAWRAKDKADHQIWSTHIERSGFKPTPFHDRQYFDAIYFREAGGILFEIATDSPGFARDEKPEQLGEKLMLPPWFEADRAMFEARLEPIQVRILEEDLI